MSLHAEQEKYGDAWALPGYRTFSPGAHRVPMFAEMVREHLGLDPSQLPVIDAGCGAGDGALALDAAGFTIDGLIDLVDVRSDAVRARGWSFLEAPLWSPPPYPLPRYQGCASAVYCCDVMEHIAPQFTGLVASNLLRWAPYAFFSISFEPDSFGVWVGQPLHLTVEPFTWWKELLGTIGHVIEARDLIGQGVFLVERGCR